MLSEETRCDYAKRKMRMTGIEQQRALKPRIARNVTMWLKKESMKHGFHSPYSYTRPTVAD